MNRFIIIAAALLSFASTSHAGGYSRDQGAAIITAQLRLAAVTQPSVERTTEDERVRKAFIAERLAELRARIAAGSTNSSMFRLLVSDLQRAGATAELTELGLQ